MKGCRLVYTSDATVEFNKRALLDLLHQSRDYNSLDGICGFLYYEAGLFFQVLEGEEHKIMAAFERIKRDARHANIEVISKVAVDSFLFDNWSMGCIAFKDPVLSYIPGVSQVSESKRRMELMTQYLPQIASLMHDDPDLNLTE